MDMNPEAPIDAARCPLCGGDNRCAMEIGRATGQDPGTCWCVNATFDSNLLDRLPDAARGKACICSDCVRRLAAPSQA